MEEVQGLNKMVVLKFMLGASTDGETASPKWFCDRKLVEFTGPAFGRATLKPALDILEQPKVMRDVVVW